MKFSIITPMYNSEQYIGRMIQAVKDLDYPKDLIEIIIIDNGSDDDSVKITKEMGVSCSVMKGASISHMRNAGAVKASGEILGFVDSDCLVNRDWAINAIDFLDYEVGIVGGYYGLGDSPGWIERTWYDLKKDVAGDVSFVSAGNMVIKAKLFNEIGGFDESVETGEDWDFCQRVIGEGYRVVNQPSLHVKHLGNYKSLLGIIKKERWYGRGMFSVLKGRMLTKPLLVSFLFLILLLVAVLSLLIGSYSVTIVTFIFLVFLILIMSFHFTRNVESKRFSIFIKCIPISFCYVVGRSLSLLDLLKRRVAS
jgi:glycosyltransferase involved in cell wall biosynthesis